MPLHSLGAVAAPAAAVTQSVDTEKPKEAEATAAPALGDRNAAFVAPQPMPGKSQHAILRTQEPFAAVRQTKTASDPAPAGRSEPSLFERITGTGRARNREQQIAADASGKTSPSAASAGLAQGSKAAAVSSEPTVTSGEPLERIISPRHDDTNLDIPAFLRRQAN